MTPEDRAAILTRPWTVDEASLLAAEHERIRVAAGAEDHETALEAVNRLKADSERRARTIEDLRRTAGVTVSPEAYDELRRENDSLRAEMVALRLELSARRFVDSVCRESVYVADDGRVAVWDRYSGEHGELSPDYPTLARSLGWDGEA